MRRYLRFFGAYVGLNFSSAMEYRAAFLSQTVGMALNNALMLVFWWMFFQRFPRVSNWALRDVLVLWAVVATSFGLGVGLFGNAMKLATVISRGQLDYYLTMPKYPLLHVLISRMGTSAWGDVGFGCVVFLAAGPVSATRLLLFCLLCCTGCAIFVAYHVVAGSVAFWAGNAENFAPQASGALVNFATYPGSIFHGWVRVLTFTAIPAAMLGHVPVEQLRRPQPLAIAGIGAFAAVALLIAATVFQLGLRRYQSGNLIEMRG